MKNSNLLYWIITGLFAGFMIFSAVPNIMNSPESVAMITGLGYPKYFIPFIGVAKLIGSIVILIPNFRRLKEWAYAGLFFDLFSATYSIFATGPFQTGVLFMFVFIGFLFFSYYLWHKKIGTI